MELEIKNGNRNSNLMHKSDNKGVHISSNGEKGIDTIRTLVGQVINKHKYCLNNNEVQDVIDVSGKGIELD